MNEKEYDEEIKILNALEWAKQYAYDWKGYVVHFGNSLGCVFYVRS
jgi:hypothetical protein